MFSSDQFPGPPDVVFENPTPKGVSKNNKWAYLFQAYWLGISENPGAPYLIKKGPNSAAIPTKLEQPGPPYNHNTTGMFTPFEGFVYDSKNT